MSLNISVVITTYNRPDCLLEALDGVKSQLLLPYEIIIIDDFSSDGSTDVIKKYEAEYDFIKTYFKEENKGKGHSQKIAKEFVTGDYVIIQDADLEYDPDEINKLLKIAIDEKKLGKLC